MPKKQKLQRVISAAPNDLGIAVQDTANPGAWGELPSASIGITPAHYTYTYPTQHTGSIHEHPDAGDRRWGEGPENESIDNRTASHYRYTVKHRPEEGPEPLFYANHSKPQVITLFAHHQLREHVPSLLGMAALESHARWGEYPEASEDLSRHSGAIVDRLASKGLIEQPDMRHTNSIDKDQPDHKYYKEQDALDPRGSYSGIKSYAIEHQRMNLGSQFIRHALRPDRKQQGLAEPQQGTLF